MPPSQSRASAAGDWPGGWTQTYAQIDTEAGPHGFDRAYFVQQVAGLSQIAGDLMRVRPAVIDLGWGKLESALAGLPDSGFVAPGDAAAKRRRLVDRYLGAFRHIEAASSRGADGALRELAADIAADVVPDHGRALSAWWMRSGRSSPERPGMVRARLTSRRPDAESRVVFGRPDRRCREGGNDA